MISIPASQNDAPEFDQFAQSYADLLDDPIRERFATDPLHFHRRKWLVLQRLLCRAGVSAASTRWLDVGCGRGDLLQLAGSNFAQATGCDPSAGMLACCAPYRVHQQPSAVELPIDTRSVNLVTAVCVYHHVHGTARTLLTNEIRRVLAPGGLCCIIEHNPWNPVTRAIVRRCPVDVDAELLTAPATSRLLRSCGFQSLATEYFLYLPQSLFGLLSPVERILHQLPLGGQYAQLARLTRNP
jgi:SAM-dependent methyltransferase